MLTPLAALAYGMRGSMATLSYITVATLARDVSLSPSSESWETAPHCSVAASGREPEMGEGVPEQMKWWAIQDLNL